MSKVIDITPIKIMKDWFLSHYEDPAESTPVDSGEYVYIWGEPESPEEALGSQFFGIYSEELIERAAKQLEDEYDIYEWTPIPKEEEEES